MVATRGAGLADRADLGVLVGRVGRRQVGQRRQGGIALDADRGLRIAQLPAPRGERGELLALLGRRRPLATTAGAILLGLEFLQRGADFTPALIELEHSIDRRRGVLPATGQRRPHHVGLATD